MTDLAGAILVIEDDHDIRDALVDSLEEEGFAAVAASSCGAALELLRASASPPAVILLDLMMPGMTGTEFRAAQRADPKIAAVPVVVVSAASNAEERAAALEPVAFLKKPLKLRALLEIAGRYARPHG